MSMASLEHFQKMGSVMMKFREDDFLCDTVLIADDKSLRAHSVLLAAASTAFRDAFSDNSNASIPYNIGLPGFDSDTLEIALQVIYTGELILPMKYSSEDELNKLFELLSFLGLDVKKWNGCQVIVTRYTKFLVVINVYFV